MPHLSVLLFQAPLLTTPVVYFLLFIQFLCTVLLPGLWEVKMGVRWRGEVGRRTLGRGDKGVSLKPYFGWYLLRNSDSMRNRTDPRWARTLLDEQSGVCGPSPHRSPSSSSPLPSQHKFTQSSHSFFFFFFITLAQWLPIWEVFFSLLVTTFTFFFCFKSCALEQERRIWTHGGSGHFMDQIVEEFNVAFLWRIKIRSLCFSRQHMKWFLCTVFFLGILPSYHPLPSPLYSVTRSQRGTTEKGVVTVCVSE